MTYEFESFINFTFGTLNYSPMSGKNVVKILTSLEKSRNY